MNAYQAIKQDGPGTVGLIRSAMVPGKNGMGEGAFIKLFLPSPRLPALNIKSHLVITTLF